MIQSLYTMNYNHTHTHIYLMFSMSEMCSSDVPGGVSIIR